MTEINKEEPLIPSVIMEEVIKIFMNSGEPKLSFKQLKKKLSHRYTVEQLHAAVNILQHENRLTKKGTVIFLSKEKKQEKKNENKFTDDRKGDVLEGIIEFTQSGNAWVMSPESQAADFKLNNAATCSWRNKSRIS